jgi:anti-anti-sigma factor
MDSRTDLRDLSLRVETVHEALATRIILIGEADIANVDALEAALAGVCLAGASQVQLQVSELAFADVATLRLLMAFARQTRRSGRQVVTLGAKPVLEKVARILGADADLGLEPGCRSPENV